jgi:hypothetical protein
MICTINTVKFGSQQTGRFGMSVVSYDIVYTFLIMRVLFMHKLNS